MIRQLAAAAALAVAILAGSSVPAEGTAVPTYVPLPDERFVEFVAPASIAPAPLQRPVAPSWAPTSISGRELVWPRLWAGETGVVSHYGYDRRYDTYVALPWPWGVGWEVTICGAGGCWSGVSNDTGPERRLHRVADLGRPIWERVCGVPASFGLCPATVTVTGRAE